MYAKGSPKEYKQKFNRSMKSEREENWMKPKVSIHSNKDIKS
jgi:hypothetical protein